MKRKFKKKVQKIKKKKSIKSEIERDRKISKRNILKFSVEIKKKKYIFFKKWRTIIIITLCNKIQWSINRKGKFLTLCQNS